MCGGVDKPTEVHPMSKRELRSDDEAGFLRAFRDECFDIVAEEKVRLEFTLRLPIQAAGLVIHGEAFKRDAQGDEQLYATFSQPYPTHVANRLHAALYRAAIRLGVEVRDRRRAEEMGDEQATGE